VVVILEARVVNRSTFSLELRRMDRKYGKRDGGKEKVGFLLGAEESDI
jgi:hypothetical protein